MLLCTYQAPAEKLVAALGQVHHTGVICSVFLQAQDMHRDGYLGATEYEVTMKQIVNEQKSIQGAALVRGCCHNLPSNQKSKEKAVKLQWDTAV